MLGKPNREEIRVRIRVYKPAEFIVKRKSPPDPRRGGKKGLESTRGSSVGNHKLIDEWRARNA